MELKPFPRLVLIIAVVGGIGWGIYSANALLSKAHPTAAASEITQTLAPPAQATVALAPVQPSATPDAPTANAGLDKLLSAGAKK